MRCYKCGKENPPDASFCVECGHQFAGEKIDFDDVNKGHFVQSVALFICVVLIIVTAHISDLPLIKYECLFNCFFIIVIALFAALDVNGFRSLFRFSFNTKAITRIALATPVIALVVTIVGGFLVKVTGAVEINYYTRYLTGTRHVYLLEILFVSILPGLLEEFLFRGILFSHLLKLTTPKVTIAITAILFAFVHFSMLSLLWLVPIGLVLGYLRYRYRSVFYSIFFHVFYNACAFFVQMAFFKLNIFS
jgi:uncharacterized protein